LNFYQTKDGMVEPTCEQFHKWKLNGMPVKYVQMDRAGDYKKLKARSDLSDWKLNLSFEITASDTPQQNHLVKVGHRHSSQLWLSNDVLSKHSAHCQIQSFQGSKVATRYIHFFGSNPKFVETSLHNLGGSWYHQSEDQGDTQDCRLRRPMYVCWIRHQPRRQLLQNVEPVHRT
jgi:hypothetical protein